MTMLSENQMVIISVLFTRCDKAEYDEATTPANWDSFVAAARPGLRTALSAPLSFDDYRHFFNLVLTPGMPHALPPVESLYKDWGGHKAGIQHGQGFYLGDAAHHVESVFKALEIGIPAGYSAMPDHLLLLLELYTFLSEHADLHEVQEFAVRHFDWLDTYRKLLAMRVESEEDICLVRVSEFYQRIIDYLEDMVTNEQVAQSA